MSDMRAHYTNEVKQQFYTACKQKFYTVVKPPGSWTPAFPPGSTSPHTLFEGKRTWQKILKKNAKIICINRTCDSGAALAN
jgi:hypothetical protein